MIFSYRPMRRLFSVLLTIQIVLAGGCSKIECAQYEKFVKNREERQLLINWVDSNIFSREFNDGDFEMGRLVGPGHYFSTFSSSKAGLKVPEWLSGYELRGIGRNKLRPDSLFFGIRSYKGVIVSRGKMEDWLRDNNGYAIDIAMKSDRVALLCYHE